MAREGRVTGLDVNDAEALEAVRHVEDDGFRLHMKTPYERRLCVHNRRLCEAVKCYDIHVGLEVDPLKKLREHKVCLYHVVVHDVRHTMTLLECLDEQLVTLQSQTEQCDFKEKHSPPHPTLVCQTPRDEGALKVLFFHRDIVKHLSGHCDAIISRFRSRPHADL